MEMIP
jgi:hypothetical protein